LPRDGLGRLYNLDTINRNLNPTLAHFFAAGVGDEDTDNIVAGKPVGEVESAEYVILHRLCARSIKQRHPLLFSLGPRAWRSYRPKWGSVAVPKKVTGLSAVMPAGGEVIETTALNASVTGGRVGTGVSAGVPGVSSSKMTRSFCAATVCSARAWCGTG